MHVMGHLQALLWTLEQGLGKVWTGEVREAWAATYETVRSVMEPALMAAAKEAASMEDGAKRQRRLVQESWALVERDLDAHGVRFFLRIFEMAPGALQLFSFRNAPNLAKSPELQAHASRVMRTVGQAVAGLSDVKTLIPVLQSLGAAHAKYGVQPEHFPVVGQVWSVCMGEVPCMCLVKVHASLWFFGCLCMYVCVSVRESERLCVCMWLCVCMHICG